MCCVCYFQGCKDKLETLLKDKLYVVGAIGVTVVVIQVRSKFDQMMFSLYIINTLPNKQAMRIKEVIS